VASLPSVLDELEASLVIEKPSRKAQRIGPIPTTFGGFGW
jgi:hypothetical protein